MSPQERTRLERVEKFIRRLTLNSYLAKAADTGGRVVGNRNTLEPGEQDLARSVIGGDGPLAALQRRVRELEQLVRDLVARLGGNPVAQSEAVLAKAVSGFHDAGSLLAYADTVISDPTVMGVVSGHFAVGDMLEAKRTVLEAAERKTLAKAPEVMAQVAGAGTDADVASRSSGATTLELDARFKKLEPFMARLEARMAQLEHRSMSIAPVDTGQVMAKATGPKRKRTPEETAAYLHSMVDAYIDDPSTAGMLSSKIQAGQYAEARSILNGAKRAHESAKIVAERKLF